MPWFFAYALVFAVPLFGMYYYNVKNILNAGEILWRWNRKRVRGWLVPAVSFVNLLPLAALATYWVGGREAGQAFSGENRIVDVVFVYPFWISLVVCVEVFLLLILWRGVKVFIRKRVSEVFQASVTVALVIFGVTYSSARVYLDTWTIRLHERDVKLPAEFSALDGIRIVQVADVQGDGRTTPRIIEELIDKANALHPDIVFFCGDVVTSGPKYVESTATLLGGLQARYGKYAAVGDHDMFSGERRVVDGLRRNGFVVPLDTSVRTTINGVPIIITGVVYTYRQRASTDALGEAMRSGNPTDHDYRIFLVHQPNEGLIRYAQDEGYHLFVAGHTHGGAIAFGVPSLLLIPPSRFETRYFSGFYDLGSMVVSVNNGLGHTLAPIRFQAPVEVTLIHLRR